MKTSQLSLSAAVAFLLASNGPALARDAGPALSASCDLLVSRGEEALTSHLDPGAAFALWREAGASCNAVDLEPVLAARLLSGQSLLPENASREGALLDEAVRLLDRHDPDQAKVLAEVLQRRLTSEAYRQAAPDRVEAELRRSSRCERLPSGKAAPRFWPPK